MKTTTNTQDTPRSLPLLAQFATVVPVMVATMVWGGAAPAAPLVRPLDDAMSLAYAGGATATAAETIAGHDLTGKEAIVTGGYGGIGYETSKALASAGARVVIAGRDAGKGDAAVARLKEATGNEKIVFRSLDLSSLESVTDWARRHVATGKPLHILINNAGIMAAPLQRTDDGFEAHFGVNHLAHFALTLGLLPCLRIAGGHA